MISGEVWVGWLGIAEEGHENKESIPFLSAAIGLVLELVRNACFPTNQQTNAVACRWMMSQAG